MELGSWTAIWVTTGCKYLLLILRCIGILDYKLVAFVPNKILYAKNKNKTTFWNTISKQLLFVKCLLVQNNLFRHNSDFSSRDIHRWRISLMVMKRSVTGPNPGRLHYGRLKDLFSFPLYHRGRGRRGKINSILKIFLTRSESPL